MRGKKRPGIIVTSAVTDDEFRFMSDGWNTIKHPNPELMHKAHKCIEDATDHKDAIKRLTDAGFKVMLDPELEKMN